MIKELIKSPRPYYTMAGKAFDGLYQEKVKKDEEKAISAYRNGIASGTEITGHGTYYRSMSYLGLGRIYAKQGLKDKATYNLEKAIEVSESEAIDKEAQEILDSIR